MPPSPRVPSLQGGLGPMGGQATWWLVHSAEQSEDAIDCYVTEVHRLLRWGLQRQCSSSGAWVARLAAWG